MLYDTLKGEDLSAFLEWRKKQLNMCLFVGEDTNKHQDEHCDLKNMFAGEDTSKHHEND